MITDRKGLLAPEKKSPKKDLISSLITVSIPLITRVCNQDPCFVRRNELDLPRANNHENLSILKEVK